MKNENNFKGIHMALQGTGHKKMKQPCQDVCAHEINDRFCAAVLCDGAGSASKSRLGAKTACKETLNFLNQMAPGILETADLKDLMQSLINHLLKKLKQTARLHFCSIKDMACTYLLAVITEKRYFTIHIGDGLIVALINDQPEVISYPDNDGYINCTWFLTSPEVMNHVQIQTGDSQNLEGIFLTSDGIQSCIYDPKTRNLIPSFSRFFNTLQENEEAKAQEIITSSIQSAFMKKTEDDCSIVLLSVQK